LARPGSIRQRASATTSKVIGGSAARSWRFWSLANGFAQRRAQGKTPRAREAKSNNPKTAQVIRKLPNQKGVTEGSTEF
jgi:hypothetical protein